MNMNPYLSFNGDCAAAFKLYERCLGAKIHALITYADTPMADHFGPEWRDKVAHARLEVGGHLLMGGDTSADNYEQPKGFSVTINTDEPVEAERIFRELSEGGTVRMAMEENFFALRFAVLTDRFGIPWMVMCERPHP